jgi:hypothetical protein
VAVVVRRGLAIASLLLAVAGVALNLYGWRHPAVITPGLTPIIDTVPQTLSADAFWQAAERLPGEADVPYAERLRRLVGDRMLLVDPKHLRPGFAENWALWLYARARGRFEWVDTGRSVQMGGGFCSAHAMVYNTVAQAHGLRSRIWALDGHVVNEVWLDQRWQVIDADYGISFGKSMQTLEQEPETVYQAYLGVGRPDWSARHWQRVYSRADHHQAHDSAERFAWKAWLVERFSWVLIWGLPALLGAIGLRGLKAGRRAEPAAGPM